MYAVKYSKVKCKVGDGIHMLYVLLCNVNVMSCQVTSEFVVILVCTSEDVTFNKVTCREGLLQALEPPVQRLLATAATSSQGQEGGEGMVMVNLLVLLCGRPEQVVALEQNGASNTLENTLQVRVLFWKWWEE